MKNEMTYTEAFARLEKITQDIEQGTLDIDNLAAALKEAQELLKLCKEKIGNIEKEVNQILQKDEQE